MADSKISNLDAVTSLTDDDLLVVVNDPAGTPTTNKITAANALGGKADLDGATFTGNVSLSNSRLLLADGSAASPAIGFTNDQDSGLYYSGGAVRVAFNGEQTFAFGGGIAYSEDLLPSATETHALGGELNRWSTFYTEDGNFSGTATLASADINGGTIDDTVIGATTSVAGTFTNLTATGTLSGISYPPTVTTIVGDTTSGIWDANSPPRKYITGIATDCPISGTAYVPARTGPHILSFASFLFSDTVNSEYSFYFIGYEGGSQLFSVELYTPVISIMTALTSKILDLTAGNSYTFYLLSAAPNEAYIRQDLASRNFVDCVFLG